MQMRFISTLTCIWKFLPNADILFKQPLSWPSQCSQSSPEPGRSFGLMSACGLQNGKMSPRVQAHCVPPPRAAFRHPLHPQGETPPSAQPPWLGWAPRLPGHPWSSPRPGSSDSRLPLHLFLPTPPLRLASQAAHVSPPPAASPALSLEQLHPQLTSSRDLTHHPNPESN